MKINSLKTFYNKINNKENIFSPIITSELNNILDVNFISTINENINKFIEENYFPPNLLICGKNTYENLFNLKTIMNNKISVIYCPLLKENECFIGHTNTNINIKQYLKGK